jgi:hypothetical protein
MANQEALMALVEDADDLKDADQRQAEPSSSFEAFVANIRNSSLL